MAIIGEPIIKLDPNGKASIISFNVPDATRYNGRNYRCHQAIFHNHRSRTSRQVVSQLDTSSGTL